MQMVQVSSFSLGATTQVVQESAGKGLLLETGL